MNCPITSDVRIALCREVLEGLATGDALGEACSYYYDDARKTLSGHIPKLGSLRYTDDTEMASAIFEVLICLKGIDEDVLAWQFRRRYQRDPERGYGKMTRRFLEFVECLPVPRRLPRSHHLHLNVSRSPFSGSPFGASIA